jgi:hypothetical protein
MNIKELKEIKDRKEPKKIKELKSVINFTDTEIREKPSRIDDPSESYGHIRNWPVTSSDAPSPNYPGSVIPGFGYSRVRSFSGSVVPGFGHSRVPVVPGT